MGNYQKNFINWATVQEDIETRSRTIVKAGSIHWVNIGINIGSEQDGKGPRFTRPAMILKVINDRLAIIIPTSSQIRRNKYRYKLLIAGTPHMLLLDQIRTVDIKRLEGYIDETPSTVLRQIRSAVANLIDE